MWEGTYAGRRVAVRRSRRSPESLAWELDLLELLAARGFHVPAVVRSDDGARAVGGVVVQEWITGREPESTADWRLVADELDRVHSAMRDVVQRPGCHVVTDIDRHGASVDADLRALPDDDAALVLGVFGTAHRSPVSLVHGDPCAANIRIDEGDRVWLLDWDESRVDLTWHDLSNLGVQVLHDDDHRIAKRLSDAWEAVNAWLAEPVYARMRLDNLTRRV